MKLLITGGAGFIGSHVAEFYAKKGHSVIVYDNLSREKLMNKKSKNTDFNWNYLKQFKNITLIKEDILNLKELNKACKGVDIIIHAAAQTAVTTSVKDPMSDFKTNIIGTFNVLEAARENKVKNVLYCSTNKVYGNNVNTIPLLESDKYYSFDENYKNGIPETFNTDLCEHTPYGSSKYSADVYTQDYAYMYGIKTGVFRMSCIYGTRQFGIEDQGWVVWFTIATLTRKPITIYGDGKQVRDVLHVSDLIDLFDKFIHSPIKHGVYNVGGGPKNTLSLLQLLDILKKHTDKEVKLTYSDWRPSDQKVYISNISKAKQELAWEPKVTPKEGVKELINWVNGNLNLF